MAKLSKDRLARFGWDADQDEVVLEYCPDDDGEPAQEPEPTPPAKPQGR